MGLQTKLDITNPTVPTSGGDYEFQVILTSGTVTFARSFDNGDTFEDITDGSFSVDSNGVMTLGNGVLRATVTGDGVAWISRI